MGMLRFFKILWKEFNRHYCMQRASAMAYATLLSLVPLIAVFFSLFASFVQFNEIKKRIQSRLLLHFLPNSGTKVGEVISQYIDQFAANTTTVSIFGIVGLGIASLALFNTVENSFNFIWDIKDKRTVIQKYNAWAGVLLGLPVLIGLSVYISSMLKFKNIMNINLQLEFLQKAYYFFFPFVLSWVAFIVAYKIIPHTLVKWRWAAVGGVIGGTLWELAKIIFGYYTTHVVNYNLIYGSLGTIPLFLGWLYLTWLIVLIGMELTYCLQNYKLLCDQLSESEANC